MTIPLLVVLLTAGLYFLAILFLGRISARGAGRGKEEYFVAGRSLRGFVLFASMFGTNMTAFVMLGLAGQSYRGGLGTWAMLLGASVLVLPIHFYLGYRCWLVARREGITTPSEFYRERFGSETLGVVAFFFLCLWTLPVVLTGVIGGARVFESLTDGGVPYWLGAFIITAVVAYYTTAGGMRATAWTNTLQTTVFLGFLLLAVVYVPIHAGGPGALLSQVQVAGPHLATRVWEEPTGLGPTLSFFVLFSSANFATPYLWVRMISARSGRSLRQMATLYPIAIALAWAPAVLLGVWATAIVPGLEGPAADSVVFALSGAIFPTWLVALGLISLFAIVMSSMDAQALTISNLFTVDVVQRFTGLTDSEKDRARVVWYARCFVLVLLAILYGVSLMPLPTVFDLATFAFTGFMCFFPLMVGGVLWRRATAAGAVASVLVGQAVAITGFLELYPFPYGLQPPVWVALSTWGTFVVVSLLTRPPDAERIERFHGVWDHVWRANLPRGRTPAPSPRRVTPAS
ncbi:sodium:solute symporter family protein [Allosalinactinospora lopnorensis]|uniref:sodium:solute symporter family protein n=1 Tax=Allosalinactinospora lopnorensis TaxID=1352348 RepID=UPI000623F300|nr:sodium:solute symporter family protein [Allosalinactinospora lopnorensis]